MFNQISLIKCEQLGVKVEAESNICFQFISTFYLNLQITIKPN